MIKKETIEEIIEAARVEEVVGDYVVLKRRGANLLGLCPFHNEKTPSFSVSPSKGIYKCFGCGKAGNALQFVMEHEHFTYPEALRHLAARYHITIEEDFSTPINKEGEDEKETLYHIMTNAQLFFTERLFETEQGKAVALTYFKQRNIREETIRKFLLGYSTDVWDEFIRHALKEGYKLDQVVKSGLAVHGEGKYFDRFRGRVIFPIQNLSGRVIGFGGRILITDKNKPKYINSPESDIYVKSKVLYGLYQAKNAIITNNNCLLVEGYTDVISMHQAGIQNVVASSGTSLTQDQIKLISRYTKNITILYDGDDAGIKASFRGIDMILEQGMRVKVVLFPEGEDPDSYARNHSSSELEAFLKTQSTDFILFKTRLLLKEASNDPLKRVDVLKEFINTITLIPDALDRIAYVKQSSELLDMPEQAIMNQLNKQRVNKSKSFTTSEKESLRNTPEIKNIVEEDTEENLIEIHEREIVRILLNYGTRELMMMDEETKSVKPIKVYKLIDNIFNNNEFVFENHHYKEIYEFYLLNVAMNNPIENLMTNHTDSAIKNTYINLVSTLYEASPYWLEFHDIHIPIESDEKILARTIPGMLFSLKKIILDKSIEVLKNQIKHNPDDYISAMEQITVLEKRRILFSKELGRNLL